MKKLKRVILSIVLVAVMVVPISVSAVEVRNSVTYECPVCGVPYHKYSNKIGNCHDCGQPVYHYYCIVGHTGDTLCSACGKHYSN